MSPRDSNKQLDLFRPRLLLFSRGNSSFFFFTETNGECEAHGCGFCAEGEYNPIGGNRRKMRQLRIETVGFIEAAEWNILSFRGALISMKNETEIQSFSV